MTSGRVCYANEEKIDEGGDIAKLLKTCSERASTFAIRDQQLKDKEECVRMKQDMSNA